MNPLPMVHTLPRLPEEIINDVLQLEKEVEKILNHPGYFSPADLPPDPNSTIFLSYSNPALLLSHSHS